MFICFYHYHLLHQHVIVIHFSETAIIYMAALMEDYIQILKMSTTSTNIHERVAFFSIVVRITQGFYLA